MRYKFNRLLGKIFYCIAMVILVTGLIAVELLHFVYRIICDFPHIDVKSIFECYKENNTEAWEIIKERWKEL